MLRKIHRPSALTCLRSTKKSDSMSPPTAAPASAIRIATSARTRYDSSDVEAAVYSPPYSSAIASTSLGRPSAVLASALNSHCGPGCRWNTHRIARSSTVPTRKITPAA